MEYQSYELNNRIRLIHLPAKSEIAYCGLIVNTGSRDEGANEQGMAHFIEHCVFKGTKKRKAYHILSRLDDVGGELNAYTTKEESCIHATFLKEFYPRTLELISDIVFNSVFPEKEIQKEKDVVIDEINSYNDSPSDLIFDDFEDLVFPNHPIGRNILGTKENIRNFTRKDVKHFILNKYHTDQMVVASVGDINFTKLIRLFEKYFSLVKKHERKTNRTPIIEYIPRHLEVKKNTHQSHCIIGNQAYDMDHEKRIGLLLLNNLLGGTGLNNRLNMVLREKHGIAYNIESHYVSYTDTGVLNIYLGTDHSALEKSIKLTLKELSKLRTKNLGTVQLHKSKTQIMGQLAISTENKENLMLSMGKSFLLFNKITPIDELFKKIEAIQSKDLLEIANEIFDQDKLSFLIYN